MLLADINDNEGEALLMKLQYLDLYLKNFSTVFGS
jgi:hypothetical protein